MVVNLPNLGPLAFPGGALYLIRRKNAFLRAFRVPTVKFRLDLAVLGQTYQGPGERLCRRSEIQRERNRWSWHKPGSATNPLGHFDPNPNQPQRASVSPGVKRKVVTPP